MKKIKNKNEKSEKPLNKVDKQSKAIVSHEDKKEQALKIALAAKTKQLKKNPHAISKKQLKEKKKELLESLKKEVIVESVDPTKKKKKSKQSKPDTEIPKSTEPTQSSPNKKKKNKKPKPQVPDTTNADAKPSEGEADKPKKKKKKSKPSTEEVPKTTDPATSPKKKKKKPKQPKLPEDKKLSTPECTVFVGNLGQNTKKQHLATLFKTFGNVVSVRLRTALGNTLFKHKSRKETECLNAYVVMDTPENAEKALALSGTEFRGRHIRVTKSLKGNFITDESSKRTIFVGNLKFKVTEETLHELFSSCGEIEAVRTMKNDKGCKGIGYVTFKTKEAVHLAQELNGTLVFGRAARVERYSTRKLAEKAASKPKPEKGSKKDDPKFKNKNIKKDDTKKKDYRGVKTAMKKKKFNKKKLGGNPLQRKLAKKIAPKEA